MSSRCRAVIRSCFRVLCDGFFFLIITPISFPHPTRQHARLGVFTMNAADGALVGRLQDVATRPQHQRRGLATALVAAALDEVLVRRGGRGLYVCALTDDTPIVMYRGQGFRDLGEQDRERVRLFPRRTRGDPEAKLRVLFVPLEEWRQDVASNP